MQRVVTCGNREFEKLWSCNTCLQVGRTYTLYQSQKFYHAGFFLVSVKDFYCWYILLATKEFEQLQWVETVVSYSLEVKEF